MGDTERLSPRARRTLLAIARDTLRERLTRGVEPASTCADPELQEVRGAFVTLHRDGRLRGCIGSFQASTPLHQTVAEMAVAAALEDPRFPPLEPDELRWCDLEISALTPLRPIAPEEVEVGRHGLYVVQGRARGVLLPQVPVQYGWSRVRFLEETCRKAGLPRDAWRDPSTRLFGFEAEVFGEHDPDLAPAPG